MFPEGFYMEPPPERDLKRLDAAFIRTHECGGFPAVISVRIQPLLLNTSKDPLYRFSFLFQTPLPKNPTIFQPLFSKDCQSFL